MKRRLRMLLRRALRSIVTLHGSPEAIALGTAIGVFVAFTPTIGFQMLTAALIATLLKANRPAAVIPPWITNPLTIPPIFALTYWLGTFFRSGPSAGEVYHRLVGVVAGFKHLDFYAVWQQFREFLQLGGDVFVPMMIGGIIVGTICAVISYPLTLRAVIRYRRRRALRRQRRALRRAKKNAARAGADRTAQVEDQGEPQERN